IKMLFTLSLFLVTIPASADEIFSLKAGYISLNPSGQVAATGAGIAGTRVDMDRDLGMSRSNGVMVEAALQLGDGRLSATYLPLKFTGTGTLQRTVNFNGQTYSAGSTVASTFKADIYDISYTYYLINMDDAPSRLQIGIDTSVKITKAETTLNASALGINQTRSATIPIPTIGLRGRVALADFLGLSGRIGYLGYAGNHFLDGEAQVEFSPLPMLGIFGGYRYIKLKVDNSGVFADARFSGPFAGALFRF
ncbi:MAG TPA: hypothetical protein VJ961_06165, partial [Mariprofundaceae bacterium]|nr:hypothetical protein [Mariprofundaceae bacterium]